MQERSPSDPESPFQAIPRQSQLDGLRCLAFLAVFIYHYQEDIYTWGRLGVEFFFSLSGFLITRILVKSESGRIDRDLRRFYFRRTLRIFPLYYLIIAVVCSNEQIDDVAGLLTFTYNIRAYLLRSMGGMMGHFWTLAVEEQFYLLYPWLLLFTPNRYRLALVSGLIVATKVFQYTAHHSAGMMPLSRVLLPYCGENLLWGLSGRSDRTSDQARSLGGNRLFSGRTSDPGVCLEARPASEAFCHRSSGNRVLGSLRSRILPDRLRGLANPGQVDRRAALVRSRRLSGTDQLWPLCLACSDLDELLLPVDSLCVFGPTPLGRAGIDDHSGQLVVAFL